MCMVQRWTDFIKVSSHGGCMEIWANPLWLTSTGNIDMSRFMRSHIQNYAQILYENRQTSTILLNVEVDECNADSEKPKKIQQLKNITKLHIKLLWSLHSNSRSVYIALFRWRVNVHNITYCHPFFRTVHWGISREGARGFKPGFQLPHWIFSIFELCICTKILSELCFYSLTPKFYTGKR